MNDVGKSLSNGTPYDGKAGQGTTAAIVANDFGVLKFTSTTTHSANAVPAHWQGREVGLICIGDTVHVAFSPNSTAEVDSGVSATAAGASAKVGVPIPDSASIETRMRIPENPAGSIYFVRESGTTNATIYMRLVG